MGLQISNLTAPEISTAWVVDNCFSVRRRPPESGFQYKNTKGEAQKEASSFFHLNGEVGQNLRYHLWDGYPPLLFF